MVLTFQKLHHTWHFFLSEEEGWKGYSTLGGPGLVWGTAGTDNWFLWKRIPDTTRQHCRDQTSDMPLHWNNCPCVTSLSFINDNIHSIFKITTESMIFQVFLVNVVPNKWRYFWSSSSTPPWRAYNVSDISQCNLPICNLSSPSHGPLPLCHQWRGWCLIHRMTYSEPQSQSMMTLECERRKDMSVHTGSSSSKQNSSTPMWFPYNHICENVLLKASF